MSGPPLFNPCPYPFGIIGSQNAGSLPADGPTLPPHLHIHHPNVNLALAHRDVDVVRA